MTPHSDSTKSLVVKDDKIPDKYGWGRLSKILQILAESIVASLVSYLIYGQLTDIKPFRIDEKTDITNFFRLHWTKISNALAMFVIILIIKLNFINQTFHLGFNGSEILNRSLARDQLNWSTTRNVLLFNFQSTKWIVNDPKTSVNFIHTFI